MKKTTLLGICGIVGSILTATIIAIDIKSRREIKEAEKAVKEMHKIADPFINGYVDSLKYTKELDSLLNKLPSDEEKIETLLEIIREREHNRCKREVKKTEKAVNGMQKIIQESQKQTVANISETQRIQNDIEKMLNKF